MIRPVPQVEEPDEPEAGASRDAEKGGYFERPGVQKFIERIRDGLAKETLKAWSHQHTQIIKNRLLVADRHYVYVNGTTGKIVDYQTLNRDSAKVLITNNQTKPIISNLIARMTARRMVAKPTPVSTDQSDIDRSKASAKALRWLFERGEFKSRDLDDAETLVVDGRSYLSFWFNDQKGPIAGYTSDGTPVYRGDIDVLSESSFDLMYDLDAKGGIQASPFVLRRVIMDRDKAEKIADRTLPETPDDDFLQERNLFPQDGQDRFKGKAIFFEWWVHPGLGAIPGDEIPGGLVITTDQDGDPVDAIKFPYPFSDPRDTRYPFEEAVYLRIPGTNIAIGMPQLLEIQQRKLNRLETQIHWHTNIAASANLLMPEGAMDEQEPVIRTGKVWKINTSTTGGILPQWMTPPILTEAVYRQKEDTVSTMQRIAMVREVSQASAPSGVTAGVALKELREQDNMNSAPIYLPLYDRRARLGKCGLKILKKYFPQQFRIELWGKRNAALYTEAFDTMDLDDGLDIQIVGDDAGWELPSEREDKILNRRVAGLYTPEQALMEIENYDPEEDAATDINCAEWENSQMLSGKYIDNRLVAKHQNTKVHLERHRLVIARPDFYGYPQPVQRAMLAHTNVHEQVEQEQQAQLAISGSQMQAPAAQAARGAAQPQQAMGGLRGRAVEQASQSV